MRKACIELFIHLFLALALSVLHTGGLRNCASTSSRLRVTLVAQMLLGNLFLVGSLCVRFLHMLLFAPATQHKTAFHFLSYFITFFDML